MSYIYIYEQLLIDNYNYLTTEEVGTKFISLMVFYEWQTVLLNVISWHRMPSLKFSRILEVACV